MKRYLFILFLFSVSIAQAQEFGILKGRVFDKTGEPLIGVNLVLEGTTTGSITDFDGNYTIKAPEGTYNLVVSYISYATRNFESIVIDANKTKVLPDIILEEEAKTLQEIVVKATVLDNTDNAITRKQQNSTNMMDGISAQSIKRTGDNNVAAAARRITGVSIEGGKYIYVRGLGDRYTKSILNGTEIPGLDPERNAVQLDLFPTNILDNIIVYKNFTPDLPGDFVGGLLDITTKNFPDRLNINFSASYGFNTQTTFNNDFILYNGSKADWFAMGYNKRKLPFSKDIKLPNPNNFSITPSQRQEIRDLALSLNNELEAIKMNNFLNQSYSFSLGNQVDKKEATWGYNFAVNYKTDYEFIPEAEYAEIRVLPEDVNKYKYDTISVQRGSIGRQNVLWNTLASAAVKKGNNSFALQLLHTQNGTKQATSRYDNNIFNVIERAEQNLEYAQKRISNVILSGKHQLKNNSRLEWANSFSLSSIVEPDLSFTNLVIIDEDSLFQAGGSAGSTKLYRFLDEINDNVKIDYTLPFKQWSKMDSKLKVGVSNVFKSRTFSTYSLTLEADPPTDPNLVNVIGGANNILAPENIWNPATDTGYYISSIISSKSDQYTSKIFNTGAYAMLELPLATKLKFVGGLRVEYTNMIYSGADRLTQKEIKNEKVLNAFKFLPSANFVYKATDKMNLRFSYNKTLARPSFKEKSNLVIYDPVIDQNFIGNLDLVITDIHNADIRWEYFFGKGDLFTVSGFYKKFLNPIEIQSFSVSAPNDLIPRNRNEAQVFGVEFELKKSLSFVHSKLENLQIGTNITYVKSMIDISDEEKMKYIVVGEEVENTRQMQGQAPYIINAFLNYSNKKSGTELNLSYNVKGKTLSIVSVGNYPYIYEDPFHNLDLRITQSLGKNKQYSLTLSAANLINDKRILFYDFLNLENAIYRKFSVGRTFNLGFSWNIK